MKFLSGWVSCYGGAASGREDEVGTRRCPPEEAGHSVSRRKRGGGAGKGEWRPSLCSITEDRAVLAERVRSRERRAVTKSRPIQAAQKSGSGSRGPVHVRGHSDDYG
ncbi:hypothetical protein CDL15_Pgr007256 [Punica granatum]|nr:hypothetical protein CDL15_Pgr007256 [Punica granatum]